MMAHPNGSSQLGVVLTRLVILKQVDGKWAFEADDVYQNHDEIMNFGK